MSPVLGALYKSSTEPLAEAATGLTDGVRSSLAAYFRQSDGMPVQGLQGPQSAAR